MTGARGNDAPAQLRVRNVTVRSGSRTLLESVSFEASAGEVVCVVGPNGAGKTTLLEAVVGMRAAESCSVVLGGTTLGSFVDRARAMAFLSDDGELPAELLVREVVSHCLSFRPRAPDFVHDLRTAFEIAALEDEPAGVLSRGERQRVALFCALAVDRAVVVLDEPFGAFDPLKLRDVLAAVRRVADRGTAVVASVHHLGDAAKIANRVLILSDGRALAWGDLASLRERAGVPEGTLEDVFLALLTRRGDAA